LLREYRELSSEVLVLPGFEFTATFGFHIVGVFDPSTSVRRMEHLLMLLGVPEDRFGSGEVGATSDVLRAYEVLNENGAIVFGAHVNSTHGVAMRNIRFGGQTKIAYTQDRNLHALEVTDLTSSSSRSTARFFNGSKAEYPRRMHIIQGSDAHRLRQDPNRATNLGIGDRATEFLLAERSFAALRAVLTGEEFDRVRPARAGGPAANAIHAARETGDSAEFSFHEKYLSGNRPTIAAVVRDIAAFANGSGGTILIGVGPLSRRTVSGVADAEATVADITQAAASRIEPTVPISTEIAAYEGKSVIVITVAAGSERPYALDSGEIPIRRGAETSPARRDEVVKLVRGEELDLAPAAAPATPGQQPAPAQAQSQSQQRDNRGRNRRSPQAPPREEADAEAGPRVAPRNGVEIVEATEVDGVRHFTMRDLRNDQITRNVTPQTARSLWAQAIREFEKGTPASERILWIDDLGYWKSVRISNGERRYHLVARDPAGQMRFFFGVSEDGLDERWRQVIAAARESNSGPQE
jgi:hypothetical protein